MNRCPVGQRATCFVSFSCVALSVTEFWCWRVSCREIGLRLKYLVVWSQRGGVLRCHGQGRFPEALGWGCCYQPVPRAAERLQQESTRLTSSLGPGSSQGLSCWVSLSFSRFFVLTDFILLQTYNFSESLSALKKYCPLWLSHSSESW